MTMKGYFSVEQTLHFKFTIYFVLTVMSRVYLNFFLHNTTMVEFHSVDNFCFSYHGISLKWYTSAAGSHFLVYTPNKQLRLK